MERVRGPQASFRPFMDGVIVRVKSMWETGIGSPVHAECACVACKTCSGTDDALRCPLCLLVVHEACALQVVKQHRRALDEIDVGDKPWQLDH
eukprot:10773792-Alexandrium_andersonii.AAC.1